MLSHIALSLLLAANAQDSDNKSNDPATFEPPPPMTVPPAPRKTLKVDLGRANLRPRNDIRRWVTVNDYPTDALRLNLEGTVRVQLSISPKGRVVDCDIIESSNHLSLDVATCKLLYRRARFNPALDKYGNAITGQYLSAVKWQIPDTSKDNLLVSNIENKSGRPFPVSYGDPKLWVNLNDYPKKAFQEGIGGNVKFEVSVLPTGKVESCSTLESSGHSLLDNKACLLWKKYALFRPALDIEGNAITGRYIGSVEWALPRRIANGKPNLEITEILRNYSPQPSTNPAMWIQIDDYPAIALAQRMEGIVGFLLNVNKFGSVTDCHLTRSSGSEALDNKTCELLTQRALFQPRLNKDGAPVEGYFLNNVRWELP